MNSIDTTVAKLSNLGNRLKLNYELFGQRNQACIERIIKFGKKYGRNYLGPGSSVLDAGCGPGVSSRVFAELVGPEGHVVCMEPSTQFHEELYQLRDDFLVNGKSRVTVVTSKIEAEDYPCPESEDGLYDVIFARLVLHHCDFISSLTSLDKFLRPGGALVLMEMVHGTAGFTARDDFPDQEGLKALNLMDKLSQDFLRRITPGYIDPFLYPSIIAEMPYKYEIADESWYTVCDDIFSPLGEMAVFLSLLTHKDKYISMALCDQETVDKAMRCYETLLHAASEGGKTHKVVVNWRTNLELISLKPT